jgi:hypothetical protein
MVSPYIILLPVCSMSQPLVETHQATLPFDDQHRYFIIGLSQKTQNNMMKAAGQVHSQDQPFSTWNLISQILSSAIFSRPDYLQLKSTMELHQKDYLLFERRNSTTTAIHKTILEVNIGAQVNNKWQGSFKPASGVVTSIVYKSMSTYPS